jgi:arginyl-tRNA synthetase
MSIDRIRRAAAEAAGSPPELIPLEAPPSPEQGDVALSFFGAAKRADVPPPEMARAVAAALEAVPGVAAASAAGGYVNIRLGYDLLFGGLEKYLGPRPLAFPASGAGRRVMVEYFSPNTNKPLHIGHLRNVFVGDALSNLMSAFGYEVVRANLYNDRGIHISKAQLAYSKYGEGATPSSLGRKGDHFVGDFYVMFGKMAEQNPDMDEEAQALLRRWEAGDTQARAAWKRMRDWVVEGFGQTLGRLGVKPFDVIYWESEFWEKGVEVIDAGLEGGLFRREEGKAVVVDLPGGDSKPLLRADGTALYITQDLYLAVRKFEEFGPLEKSIYVVASEQSDHFKALFTILKRLGHEFADVCYHLGYGLILIRGGKLKSRQGITADADQIFEILEDMSYGEVDKRHPGLPGEEKTERARRIALAALKWDFLKISTHKNINFDVQSSLSLKGDTGPYLLYTYARIRSVLRKAGLDRLPEGGPEPPEVETAERELCVMLHLFPEYCARALSTYNFSVLCAHIYNTAEKFNTYYERHRILETPPDVFAHRIRLSAAVASVLKSGLQLLGIDALEEV